MADQLLHDVDGFLSAQDSNADPDHNLKLEEVDSQQLLADTDALLQSLHTATSVQTKTAKTQILTSETKIKSKQDIAKEKARPASRCLPQATECGMGNFTATRRGIESKVDQVAATQESAGNSRVSWQLKEKMLREILWLLGPGEPTPYDNTRAEWRPKLFKGGSKLQ
ncbi:hypothetical protein PR001_g19942 [Phytophthora rubi]|uniref:Uncharacterized protein n=1 Tax=Phytophthora rubi TaxID=129364 RepID=A0A6A3NF32_9STRA|nr:hypothetical protein PR001_g19942 [Phytophthora rubi]KAE9040210.1 hypothetical protein PR002_g5076 [Phytophthora rubi]